MIITHANCEVGGQSRPETFRYDKELMPVFVRHYWDKMQG